VFTTARTLERGPNHWGGAPMLDDQASQRRKRTACPFVERCFDSPGLSDVNGPCQSCGRARLRTAPPRSAPQSRRVRSHCADTLLRASASPVPKNGSSRLLCQPIMDTASALCASVDCIRPPFNQWALTGTPRGSRRPTRAVIFVLVAVRGGFERPGESRPQRPTARALWPTGCPCNGLVSLPRGVCETQERARTLAGA